jgi:small subunit ribosomal protein S20
MEGFLLLLLTSHYNMRRNTHLSEKDKEQKKGSSSAQKRAKQNEKRRITNRMYTTRIKTSAKRLAGLLEEKNKEKALREYKDFSSYLDKAVKKGIFQQNTAARRKSRMQRKLNALA